MTILNLSVVFGPTLLRPAVNPLEAHGAGKPGDRKSKLVVTDLDVELLKRDALSEGSVVAYCIQLRVQDRIAEGSLQAPAPVSASTPGSPSPVHLRGSATAVARAESAIYSVPDTSPKHSLQTSNLMAAAAGSAATSEQLYAPPLAPEVPPHFAPGQGPGPAPLAPVAPQSSNSSSEASRDSLKSNTSEDTSRAHAAPPTGSTGRQQSLADRFVDNIISEIGAPDSELDFKYSAAVTFELPPQMTSQPQQQHPQSTKAPAPAPASKQLSKGSLTSLPETVGRQPAATATGSSTVSAGAPGYNSTNSASAAAGAGAGAIVISQEMSTSFNEISLSDMARSSSVTTRPIVNSSPPSTMSKYKLEPLKAAGPTQMQTHQVGGSSHAAAAKLKRDSNSNYSVLSSSTAAAKSAKSSASRTPTTSPSTVLLSPPIHPPASGKATSSSSNMSSLSVGAPLVSKAMYGSSSNLELLAGGAGAAAATPAASAGGGSSGAANQRPAPRPPTGAPFGSASRSRPSTGTSSDKATSGPTLKLALTPGRGGPVPPPVAALPAGRARSGGPSELAPALSAPASGKTINPFMQLQAQPQQQQITSEVNSGLRFFEGEETAI